MSEKELNKKLCEKLTDSPEELETCKLNVKEWMEKSEDFKELVNLLGSKFKKTPEEIEQAFEQTLEEESSEEKSTETSNETTTA